MFLACFDMCCSRRSWFTDKPTLWNGRYICYGITMSSRWLSVCRAVVACVRVCWFARFWYHRWRYVFDKKIFDAQYPTSNRAYTCTGNAEHSEVEQSQVLPILPNAIRMVISKTNFESHLLAAILLSGIFDTQYQISK